MKQPPANNQWWTDDRPGSMWVIIGLVVLTGIGLIAGAVWGVLELLWWLL